MIFLYKDWGKAVVGRCKFISGKQNLSARIGVNAVVGRYQ